MPVHEGGASAAYWRSESDGAVVCGLCPHACRLAEGRWGICKVRRNVGGKLELPYSGSISSIAIDPIEKKPLHHFLPGSAAFSVGFVGCNMRCPFCQNWRISQDFPTGTTRYAPGALAAAALGSGCPSIAYTYSEPCVHFEFVRETMALARGSGLKNVLVTNGCLSPGPARALLELTDAVNVDLKTWSAQAYAGTLGGDRQSVLDFIATAASLCHAEVTTLVVPGLSDDAEGIAAIANFLSSISPDIPFHLSAYHPAWKHDAPSTPTGLLERLARIAREKLRFVFVGNVAGSGADTLCPGCGKTVIARAGYRIDTRGLRKDGGSAFCSACGERLRIVV